MPCKSNPNNRLVDFGSSFQPTWLLFLDPTFFKHSMLRQNYRPRSTLKFNSNQCYPYLRNLTRNLLSKYWLFPMLELRLGKFVLEFQTSEPKRLFLDHFTRYSKPAMSLIFPRKTLSECDVAISNENHVCLWERCSAFSFREPWEDASRASQRPNSAHYYPPKADTECPGHEIPVYASSILYRDATDNPSGAFTTVQSSR